MVCATGKVTLGMTGVTPGTTAQRMPTGSRELLIKYEQRICRIIDYSVCAEHLPNARERLKAKDLIVVRSGQGRVEHQKPIFLVPIC